MVLSNRYEQTVPIFVVLDLDRTLFRSDLFFADCIDVLIALNLLDVRNANTIKQQVKATKGQDTDWVKIIESITKHPNDTLMHKLYENFSSKNDNSLYFYDGAIDLLTWLKENNVHYIIMTKGGIVTQQLKLEIVQQTIEGNIVSLITSAASKAQYIADRLNAIEGSECVLLPKEFEYPNMKVEKIYVVDDKPQHLVSSSPIITGIHINNSSTPITGAVRISEVSELLDAR